MLLSMLGTAGASFLFVPLLGRMLSLTVLVAFGFPVLRANAKGRDDVAVDVDLDQDVWLWFSPLIRHS